MNANQIQIKSIICPEFVNDTLYYIILYIYIYIYIYIYNT